MERTVVDVSEAVYTRPCAWFYRLHTWCSLRFDDNRGLEPASLRNTTESLSGVLTRSKNPRSRRAQNGRRFIWTRGVGSKSVTRTMSVTVFSSRSHRTRETTFPLSSSTQRERSKSRVVTRRSFDNNGQTPLVSEGTFYPSAVHVLHTALAAFFQVHGLRSFGDGQKRKGPPESVDKDEVRQVRRGRQVHGPEA